MNGSTKTLLGLALLAALAGGWWLGRASAPTPETSPVAAAPAEREVLYYRNPMGLPDTSPVPKKDAMGMDYLPVYADDAPATAAGTVVLPPGKVQKLGVRTEAAARERLGTVVRASASVEVDETRQFVIAPRFEGWIETLHADQTGMAVRRGQPLVSFYSPALVAALDEYRIADEAADRLAENDPASARTMRRLRDASRTRLRNWGVAEGGFRRQGKDRLMLTAPADAVVTEKLVVQGDRFGPGQTLLRLADLSSVWVVAGVPASQLADLEVGDAAIFRTPSQAGRSFAGRIDFIHPQVDLASRTVGVRIALPNPEGVLRPGLFGDVVLTGTPGEAVVTVPRSAVLDSGARQTVLVQVAPGRFEPREVRLGQRAGDRVAVLEGLREGESVVVSANFLIDAESNLTAALRGFERGAAQDAGTSSAADGDAGQAASEPAPADDPHAGHPGGH